MSHTLAETGFFPRTIPPAALLALVKELEARGVPIKIEVIEGPETRYDAELTVAEEDEEWVAAILARFSDEIDGSGTAP